MEYSKRRENYPGAFKTSSTIALQYWAPVDNLPTFSRNSILFYIHVVGPDHDFRLEAK